jgi:hypothetical protein
MPGKPLEKMEPQECYRSIELVFEDGLAEAMDRIKEQVLATFKLHGFKYSTIVVDLVGPSRTRFSK